MRLVSVDLPTLGRPTMAILGRRGAVESKWASANSTGYPDRLQGDNDDPGS